MLALSGRLCVQARQERFVSDMNRLKYQTSALPTPLLEKDTLSTTEGVSLEVDIGMKESEI
jgi:hypothetical protein